MPMNIESFLHAHLAELDPAYARLGGITEPEWRRAAAAVVDYALAERLPMPGDLAVDESLIALAEGLRAAHPHRACAALILKHFSAWTAAIRPAARPAWLEGFPRLAPGVSDLGEVGMGEVVEAVNQEPRVFPCIYLYAYCGAHVLRAVARLARHAPLAELQALVAAVPASRVEESREAERLFPAAMAVPAALGLISYLARRDVSAARGVARDLAGVLAGLASPAPYLEDFRTLVEAVGLRVAGFCLRKLPELHRRHGPERTRAFVAAAAATAESAGALAAEALLERRTAAARALLP